MHDLELLATLAGGLTAALIAGYVTERLRLSPIVGYLIAGIAVGPHTPGFTADTHLAEQLAEIGVILLMFGVGLQFHLEELLAVRRVAIPGAIAQSAVATVLGASVARFFGWDWSAAIVFGIALAVASTVVLVRILSDHRELHTPTGHIAVGWLVVEDLFTVLVLVVLPAAFAAGDSPDSLWRLGFSPAAGFGPAMALTLSVAVTFLKVAGLAVFTLAIGGRVIPRLLYRIARTRSRELFTLTVLVIALGIAVGSAAIFGVSMALGAFLAGMVVGRSEYSLRAASEALPMRDAFAVLFFVSVGMLLDPRYLLEAPGLIAATLGVVVIGKPLVAIAVVRLMRYPLRVALAIGVALAQIGEFSFIVGSLGRELGILPADAMNTLVAVAIGSIVINPLLYRWVPNLSRRARAVRVEPAARDESGRRPPSTAHRAVVVGYGPTGRTVTRLLRENGIEPTVVELNIDTVRALEGEEGVQVVYGDASQREILQGAGADTAGSLILTTDLASAQEVIRVAREMNPHLFVLSRTANLRDVQALRAAGASGVFSGEGEVALALTEALLQRLGATPDQMDRERKRVHDELFT
jgi:monovalent cation:H+ antiporter-2, CPA2 family